VASCDLKIGIGAILPHTFAGFSGGGKIVMPGVASMESIVAHHERVLRGPAGGQRWAWEQIEEASLKAGLDLKIDCLINGRGETAAIFAGDPIKAYHEGVQEARRFYATDMVGANDIVIANASAKATEAAIAALERVIGDEGARIALEKRQEGNDLRIAVVGGGSAGLTCAYHLALLGYEVQLFEAQSELGGVLRYGIPPYRLPKQVLSREIGRIKSLGVKISTGVKVGVDLPFEELRRGFNAIFLATGAHQGRRLGIPGEDLKGVYQGLDILQTVNIGEKLEIKGKIGVIGGGNTAIDVARSLLRLGCQPVIFYRRTREEMPAYSLEVEEALAEGVEIEYLVSPVRVLGENGRIVGLKLARMRLGDLGDDGRREVHPLDAPPFTVGLDGVVVAIGEDPDLSFLPHGLDDLEREGIFLGGDLLPNPRTVAHALGSGRRGALAIHRYLQGEVDLSSPQKVRNPQKATIGDIDLSWFPKGERVPLPRISKEEAVKGFQEVHKGISLAEAQREAAERCFHCGSCTRCDFCLISCPEEAIVREGRFTGSTLIDAPSAAFVPRCARGGPSPCLWSRAV